MAPTPTGTRSRSPERLADLARKRLREKIPELRRALRGRVTEHHRFLLRLHLDHLQYLEALIARVGGGSRLPWPRSRTRPGGWRRSRG